MSRSAELPGEVLADDLLWGEAPRRNGSSLWLSDAQASQLVQIGPAGVRRHALDTPVNGTWVRPDGSMAAARLRDRRIDVLRDGAVTSALADLSDLATGTLGDMTGTASGRLYVDDMGPEPWKAEPTGRLLAVAPDGTARVAADGLVFPNGLAVINDGATLVVAETLARRLTAFEIGADGQLSARRVWTDLGAMLGPKNTPDGIWPTADGSVWVAAGSGETFLQVSGSDILGAVPVPGEFAIACCLDGTDLYISTSRSTDPSLSLLEQALPAKKIRGRVARLPAPHHAALMPVVTVRKAIDKELIRGDDDVA